MNAPYPPNTQHPPSRDEFLAQTRFGNAGPAGHSPRSCNLCGGSFFREASFFQYQKDAYGSAPGADLEQVNSDMPQVILVCLCGAPQTPNIGGIRGGRHISQSIKMFMEETQKAINFLQASRLPAPAVEGLVALSDPYPSEELLAMKAKLELQDSKINGLEQRIGELIMEAETAPQTGSNTPTKTKGK